VGDPRRVRIKMSGNRLDVRGAVRIEGTALRFRLRRLQCGQAIIEMALMLPIFLILTIGIIEIGRYSYDGILIGNAARAGTAYGARSLGLSADTPGITKAVQNDYLNNGQQASTLTVPTPVLTCGCDNAGVVSDTASACFPTGSLPPTCSTGHWVVILHVTASGTFNSIFNYPGIPASITISRTSVMRVAQN
jgi:Flp pilus assembly protein TadG